MKLRIYPDSILRKKTEPVAGEDIDKLSMDLVSDMINYGGIGLAASQVGIAKSIAVVSEKVDGGLNKPLVLVNPRIIESSGSQSVEEGCLSIRGITSYVPRYARVVVETGVDDKRKIITAEGLLAVVIQHEVDHLNGILFPDRLKLFQKLWCFARARFTKKDE
jgi:peptide deformylase